MLTLSGLFFAGCHCNRPSRPLLLAGCPQALKLLLASLDRLRRPGCRRLRKWENLRRPKNGCNAESPGQSMRIPPLVALVGEEPRRTLKTSREARGPVEPGEGQLVIGRR
jgi:hypothetical protein